MGIETAAMIFAGAGSVANTVGSISQNRSAARRARRIEGMAGEQMQNAPAFLESLLRSQFNTGQDGTMQMLRSMPGASALNELSETGNPFDTSGMFEALQPLRARQLQESMGTLRAGAPGLGQRFGSAMRANEQDTVLQHLQGITAQDAGIQMQSFEAAQGRRLGAGQALNASALSLLELLGRTEQGRRTGNLQALGIASGVPQASGANYGQGGFDIGTMLLLRQLAAGNPQATPTTPTTPRTLGFSTPPLGVRT